MGSIIKKELILEGLDCANCAMKIESKVKALEGVSNASMNFVAKTLTIESEDKEKIQEILRKTKEIIKRMEPHVIVKEKEASQSITKVMILEGLGCANCAAKMEKQIKDIAGVREASVNFMTKKLTIEAESKKELERIIKEATAIVKKIESHVEVVSVAAETRQKPAESTKEANTNKIEAIRFGIGAVFFGAAVILDLSYGAELALFLISYLLIGGEVLWKAARNITRGQVFDENFLMSIATIGAFAVGEFPEGVAVMLFYQIGEWFQDLAVNRSRKSISALMDIRPDYANLKVGNTTKTVSPEEVNIGDIIIVKPGEKVPLDGKVIEGQSMLDTSALTGESVPREVEPGSDVLGGFINKNGLLTVQVTKEFGESTVSKILDLVQNASARKAPTENFITKFARYYTPAVVFIALALAVIPPFVISGATFADWVYRALVFLVISCPCALVVSIPLGFFGGIGGASKNGILIKGSNYLEALNSVETVVFDKTGTLTKGVFKVTEIAPASGMTKDEVLEYAAHAEAYSNHPIATSILKAFGKEIHKDTIKGYEEISGHGIQITVKGKEILAGNVKLMKKENIQHENTELAGTVVHVAVDKKYAGYILISDEIKEDAEKAIKGLKALGIKKTVMLTGDTKSVGESVAKRLGLDEVYAELLPDQKVEKLEMLDKQKSPKGKMIFVGDGINDAPVLARADIGFAMGGLGSDAAIEAADVVIMTDEPSKVVGAIKAARRTRAIVWQNIVFALGVKVIVLALGAGGVASMWEAVFADVGVAVLAILNAMRVLNMKGIE